MILYLNPEAGDACGLTVTNGLDQTELFWAVWDNISLYSNRAGANYYDSASSSPFFLAFLHVVCLCTLESVSVS